MLRCFLFWNENEHSEPFAIKREKVSSFLFWWKAKLGAKAASSKFGFIERPITHWLSKQHCRRTKQTFVEAWNEGNAEKITTGGIVRTYTMF